MTAILTTPTLKPAADRGETVSFISPFAPPVSLSASCNTLAKLTFLVFRGSDAMLAE